MYLITSIVIVAMLPHKIKLDRNLHKTFNLKIWLFWSLFVS